MPVVEVPGMGEVDFPDSMSDDEIAAAIQKNIGPPKSAASNFNNALQQQASNQSYARDFDQTEIPGTWARMGRGVTDVTDRISQLWVGAGEKLGLYPEGLGDVMTRQMNEEQAKYQKAIDLSKHRNMGDADVGRLAGNVGMLAPLALTPAGSSYLGSAAYGAGSGAASGLFQYDPTNSLEQGVNNVLLGAASGAVAAPLARLATQAGTDVTMKTIGRFKGLMERTKGNADPSQIMSEIPEFGLLPADARANLILEAQDQIKRTGSLNAEQLARKANLIANDVMPTKSMVTRDPRDWSMERNMQKLAQSPDEQISGMGQQLTDVYQANDRALTNRLASFSDGMPRGTQEGLGMEVMRGLDDVSNLTQKDVSSLYDMVRRKHGDILASDAKVLAKTLDDLKDNTYAEKLVSSVSNKLKRFGMLDKEGKLTSNSLTVNQSEELRKFVNTLPNDFGKRDIIKAIDADVFATTGDDFFSLARKAASERKGLLENSATQRALNAFGELSQGKTAQNFIKTQVVDGAHQDVKALIDTLGTLPREQAEQAVNSMRAGVLDHLQSKAVNANSNQFSGAALNTEMRKIGDDKLKLIFGEKMHGELKSLAKAGLDATYQPPYAAVNHSNTAPMLLSLTQKARAVPGVPLVLNEGLERAAARAGYGSQLSSALGARSVQSLPQVDPRMQIFLEMIKSGAAPAGAVGVNQLLDERRRQTNSR